MGNACTPEEAAQMDPRGAEIYDTYQKTMEKNKKLVSIFSLIHIVHFVYYCVLGARK